MRILVATALTCLAFSAQAELLQDCVLEGKVRKSQDFGLQNIIRVDFYSAKPFRSDSHCHYNGDVKFKQPKGSMIENLPSGTKVQYHFQKDSDNNTNWRMLKATL